MHLSHKYIADRFLPDKAIDLLDEAGSRVRITAYNARRSSSRTESPKVRPAHSLHQGMAAWIVKLGFSMLAPPAGLCGTPCAVQGCDWDHAGRHRLLVNLGNPRSAAAAYCRSVATAGAAAGPSSSSRGPSPWVAQVHEYLQVMETKDEAVKDGLYEEAVILHRRQHDYM